MTPTSILLGAPIGATHYVKLDGFVMYHKWIDKNTQLVYHDDYWLEGYDMGAPPHALSDLEEIVALQYSTEKLRSKLEDVVRTFDNNTGYEPSVSVFQREVYESIKEVLNG